MDNSDDRDRAEAMLLAEEEIARVRTERVVCGTHASVRAVFEPIFMAYVCWSHPYFRM